MVIVMNPSPNTSRFDAGFWMNVLQELSYPLKPVELDFQTLKGQRALPSDIEAAKVLKLYSDDYVEVTLVKLEGTSRLRRSICTRAARSWKENRLIRPLLIFTNGTDSFAVIVPGKGIGGEAKVLGLSDRLYRTDLEVLESIRFPGNAENLSKKYDREFFPYEKVRDEFFEGYRHLYEQVEKAVKKELKNESTSYAQRFLGRLMFLYFLQRKGWLKGDRRFIDTIKDYRELNRLFYESLNQEGTPGIPFLNGSLFEREEYMTGQMENRLHTKMDQLFKDSREFFNEYNFTVDETSPLEIEVSIDPALIGTVFENMLPEYERGSKGTFYTPRSETSFICRRALTNFLGLKDEISPDGKTFRDGLSKYIEELHGKKSEKDVRAFRERLLSTRILDPAVGSGGFLLIMMQEIVSLIQEAEATVGWKSDLEEYKKKLLPNLYGFDIESEAIEIARLRLWLSLIIDQKEPEPLPNLDLNIMTINDSLRLPDLQMTLDAKVEELRERFAEVKAKYMNEHYVGEKKKLKEQLQEISEEIAKKTGIDPSVIEAYMPEPANIIIMNPPYVSQKSISKDKKEYYARTYSLDKGSDLYSYFLVRALKLLSEDGVTSVISSDKWLEADYGIALQQKLKEHLIGLYGQRWKSFGADVHTVITVYSKRKNNDSLMFTYLDSYSRNDVIRHYSIDKKILKLGKWFYLRAPKVFVEKILPRLNKELVDFAHVKRGFTTNANEFFYMKNVSHLYETDFLSRPKDFEGLGINARTKENLFQKGLLYIENENGDRFVIDKKDVVPIIRGPREINSFQIPYPVTLCLYTSNPGKFTSLYIAYGEKLQIHKRAALQNRENWYVLSERKPSRILLLKTFLDKLYTPISDKPLICDQRLYILETKNPEDIWLYLNSTIFLITIQLYSRKGASSKRGAVMDAAVDDYEAAPVPDLSALHIQFDLKKLLKRNPLKYSEEIKQNDRRELDIAFLKAMGFDKPEELLSELYEAFTKVVEDRLQKGLGFPTSSESSETEVNE